jgi:antitoxin ParD1/3/4
MIARRLIIMTTMNISLPDEMKVFVEAQMVHEGYASASEYLRALIRDAQKRRAKQELEAKFREAIESGPATPMTREDWQSIEREAMERLAREQSR